MPRLDSIQIPAEASVATSVAAAPVAAGASRHSALVRVTHWITTLCFFAAILLGRDLECVDDAFV